MNRKILPILFLLTGLVFPLIGCQTKENNPPEQPIVSSPSLFTLENYPRVDGSTANIPLAVLLAQKTMDISAELAENTIAFSTTTYAYHNLTYDQADLLLVYEASEETKQILPESGVELEYYPIGLDALVFIVNESNPINNLTTQQVQDIYQGKIVNWNQVGGADAPIAAFQRDTNSGSQALMKKLVMKNLKMSQAPIEFTPAEMGELIEQLADYNNEGNALGYSVYYYAQNMYTQPGLKFLSIDGVSPSNDTIADQSYPFINQFYAVIRADEKPDSPTRKLLAYILSPEGIKVIEESGYVAIKNQ